MKLTLLSNGWQKVKDLIARNISLWQQDIYLLRIGAFTSWRSLSNKKNHPPQNLLSLSFAAGPVPYSKSVSCYNSQLG